MVPKSPRSIWQKNNQISYTLDFNEEVLSTLPLSNLLSLPANSKMSVQSFISLQKAGSRSQEWIEMEDYYNRKLWHQLTLALLKYVKTGPHNPGHLSELHKTFVSDFDHRV